MASAGPICAVELSGASGLCELQYHNALRFADKSHGQSSFIQHKGERQERAESQQFVDRQRRSKDSSNVPGSGRPGDSANRRLRVRQVQPWQPFIGKYVPGWTKQLGIIKRTDMEIRQRGQADCFASQR